MCLDMPPCASTDRPMSPCASMWTGPCDLEVVAEELVSNFCTDEALLDVIVEAILFILAVLHQVRVSGERWTLTA